MTERLLISQGVWNNLLGLWSWAGQQLEQQRFVPCWLWPTLLYSLQVKVQTCSWGLMVSTGAGITPSRKPAASIICRGLCKRKQETLFPGVVPWLHFTDKVWSWPVFLLNIWALCHRGLQGNSEEACIPKTTMTSVTDKALNGHCTQQLGEQRLLF